MNINSLFLIPTFHSEPVVYKTKNLRFYSKRTLLTILLDGNVDDQKCGSLTRGQSGVVCTAVFIFSFSRDRPAIWEQRRSSFAQLSEIDSEMYCDRIMRKGTRQVNVLKWNFLSMISINAPKFRKKHRFQRLLESVLSTS